VRASVSGRVRHEDIMKGDTSEKMKKKVSVKKKKKMMMILKQKR
jgi:hypothetical protein